MYYKNSGKRDGYDYICKICANARRKKYLNNKSPEELREVSKIRYYRNRDKNLATKKEYYKNNRDVILNRVKKHYISNKDSILQYNSQYNRDNIELLRIKRNVRYSNNREAIIARNVAYEMNRRHNDEYYRMYKNIKCRFRNAMKAYTIKGKVNSCSEYGIDFKAIYNKLGDRPSTTHHIDHIIPLSAFNLNNREHVSLAYSVENLRWLDGSENISKNDKIIEEVFENKNLVKILKEIGYFTKELCNEDNIAGIALCDE